MRKAGKARITRSGDFSRGIKIPSAAHSANVQPRLVKKI
jgi:hypothetical protein